MRRHKLKADRTIPLIRPIFWALTTATVTLSFLLWVISLFAFFPYRCMWLEEYYWVSEADFPPLYGVLFFVFFLTAWWMAAIAVSDVIQGHPVSRAELVAFATNGMVLLAVAVILWTLWGWISLDTEKKYELVAAGRWRATIPDVRGETIVLELNFAISLSVPSREVRDPDWRLRLRRADLPYTSAPRDLGARMPSRRTLGTEVGSNRTWQRKRQWHAAARPRRMRCRRKISWLVVRPHATFAHQSS